VTATKNKILFVGSFKEAAKDGSVGGQMFACRTLIMSDLKNEFQFILIDSTADSVPAPPVHKRIGKVLSRFFKLLFSLIKDRPSKVLLFSSAGLSLLEKGTMAIISKIFFTKVIFAPRSGLIKANVNNSVLYRLFTKFVINISDKVICQGASWKNFYLDLAKNSGDKMVVIQNWIDTSVYIKNRPVYKNKSSFAVEMIYIGWIEEYKGIFDLINAIALIRDDVGQLKLSVYGNGKKMEEAKKLCEELGLNKNVHFMGWADKETKLNALSRADLYVLPSHAEGFPNSLIEAMASGIPSIATNVGGISDLIVDRETGLLVEPHRPAELARAILTLYSNPELRQILSKKGKEQVIRNNSLEAMYCNLKGVLETE